MVENADFIFRYNQGVEAALIYPKNDEALRAICLFADRYRWQMIQIDVVYFTKPHEQVESRVCYLLQNDSGAASFAQYIEILRRYLLMPLQYPLNTKDQVVEFFNQVSEKPFQYISEYFPNRPYYAGTLMGKWARDTMSDRIIKRVEKGETLLNHLDD